MSLFIKNGQFGGGQTAEFDADPGGISSSDYIGSHSWAKTATGTYTARVNLNFDHAGKEGNYDNDQATVSYTISDSVPVVSPTPSVTPMPTLTPTPTVAPTPSPTAIPSPTITPIVTPVPTAMPTPTSIAINRTDLVITSFKLVDKSGLEKSAFKVNEPIYVKVMYKNQGNKAATTPDTKTYSTFYKNKPTTAAVDSGSDPTNFYSATTNLAAGASKEYGSYATHANVSAFPGVRSWTMTSAGTYIARVFEDYDARVTEADESNNQVTTSYTVTY